MDEKISEVEVIGSVHLIRDKKTGDFKTIATKGGDVLSSGILGVPEESVRPVNGPEYHYLQDRISGKQG